MRSTRLPRTLLACAALSCLAACKDPDEVLTHGIIKLEMRRAQNQASNPYIGTSRVLITMSYQECLQKNLNVMDMTAFALCRDNKLPINVFDLTRPGNIQRVVMGEQVGTMVAE